MVIKYMIIDILLDFLFVGVIDFFVLLCNIILNEK